MDSNAFKDHRTIAAEAFISQGVAIQTILPFFGSRSTKKLSSSYRTQPVLVISFFQITSAPPLLYPRGMIFGVAMVLASACFTASFTCEEIYLVPPLKQNRIM
jgi:hypothetical protein